MTPLDSWTCSKWTTDLIEKVRNLASEHKSASEIGRALNKSKNSIIGKCKRLGIRLVGQPGRRSLNPKEPVPIPAEEAQAPEEVWTGQIHAGPKHIGESCPRDCRFISGEPKAGIICGDRTKAGCSYCDRHAAIVYNR